MRRVIVLGSTGSIGVQALEVIAANPDRFELVGLAAADGHGYITNAAHAGFEFIERFDTWEGFWQQFGEVSAYAEALFGTEDGEGNQEGNDDAGYHGAPAHGGGALAEALFKFLSHQVYKHFA